MSRRVTAPRGVHKPRSGRDLEIYAAYREGENRNSIARRFRMTAETITAVIRRVHEAVYDARALARNAVS